MSKITLAPNAAGTAIFTVAAPATSTDRTLTLPDVGGTLTVQGSTITTGTSVATTSGTSFDFTGIPSWVKRITVMVAGVSTNGSSLVVVQLGTSSGLVTTGYISSSSASSSSAGFVFYGGVAADTRSGAMQILNAGGGLFIQSGSNKSTSGGAGPVGGDIVIVGTVDRLRLTTANGTDTFDAGTVNIMFEG
jgi:hypothetical protein